MVFPSAGSDPLFAQDGVPFQEKMKAYLRRHFAELLGPRVALLDRPGGLDELARIYGQGFRRRSGSPSAAERHEAA